MPLPDDAVVHRVGGAGVANLRLSPRDARLAVPGISVVVGGTPAEATAKMLAALPNSRKWRAVGDTVGSPTAADVRAAGYDVIADGPPGRARIVHPLGAAGFDDPSLAVLSAVFRETKGCLP